MEPPEGLTDLALVYIQSWFGISPAPVLAHPELRADQQL
jgi:hypothetical protein